MMYSAIFLDQVDSTQTYAKTHRTSFAKDRITCIVAKTQTGGLGQFGRAWLSKSGNLFTTLYFVVPKNFDIQNLAIQFAKIVKEVLEDEGFSPTLKHPNDLLIQGKKVAGILCEVEFLPNEIEVFVGIGLNVNMEAEDLGKVDQPATSLKCESGKAWEILPLLEKILAKSKHIIYF